MNNEINSPEVPTAMQTEAWANMFDAIEAEMAVKHYNNANGEKQMNAYPHDDRTTKFTNAEFAALSRNDDGDVIDLYDANIWMTNQQIVKLTGDDQSRVDEYQEEMRIMMAEFA